jgi:hypothetical protein
VAVESRKPGDGTKACARSGVRAVEPPMTGSTARPVT